MSEVEELSRQIADLGLGLTEEQSADIIKAMTLTSDVPEVIPEIWATEVEHAAQEDRVMRNLQPFVVVNESLLDKPGDVVHIAKLANLTAAVKVDEDADVVPQKMDASEITLQPTEWAAAVQISRKLQRATYLDIMKEATTLLGYAIAQAEDVEILDKAVFFATSSSFPDVTYTVPGDITADDVLTADQLTRTRTALRIAKAPEPFVAVIHTAQEGSLRQDERFIDASKYGSNQVTINGEIGMWQGIKIISTQNVISAADGAGGVTVYRGLMLSHRSLALAIKANPDYAEEYHALGRKTDIVSVIEFDTKALNPERYSIMFSA